MRGLPTEKYERVGNRENMHEARLTNHGSMWLRISDA